MVYFLGQTMKTIDIYDSFNKINTIFITRWLKYEEKLDPSNRWSKPHVTTTKVHSLNEVRAGLQNGIILLDSDAPSGDLTKVTGRWHYMSFHTGKH